MNTLRLMPVFLIGVAVTAFLLTLNIPRVLVFGLVIVFYLAAMVLPGIYTVYYSNSLALIERYIKRNRRKPIFAFPYALGYGSDQDIEAAIERILKTYKQTDMQSAYRTLLAIYRRQPGIAAQHAEQIGREPLRSYYMAHAAAAAGHLERAAALNKQLSEPWMSYAIDALIAYEKNDGIFHALADKSVQAARGVQKYTLLKSFERMEKFTRS